MGSSRLPGKSMMNLAGVPLVGRILERVKRCQSIDKIVLAIPATVENRELQNVANDYDIAVYAGPENDLVERYFQAATHFKADIVVRLPADNATPEPFEIDRIVNHHLALGYRAFSSNLSVIDNSGYPDGIGAEVFDFSLLQEARDKHHDPEQREHVHLNFYNYNTGEAVDECWCPISTIMCPEEFRRPDLVLDVNTEAQYKFMSRLYEELYSQNPEFHITDIIKWYDDIYLPSL